jgi:hypothetical protein
MGEAPGHLSERSHHIEVPDGERARDWDSLKRLRQEVSLSSVELASFTTPHDVLGVCDRRGPVETLSESLSDKCSRTDVVTTGAGMYLLQQLAALISEDAPHEYAGSPMLVEFAVDEDERFSSADDASSLHLVGGSFPSTNHSRIGKRQSRSSRFNSGGWSTAMTSGSDSLGGFLPSARMEGAF